MAMYFWVAKEVPGVPGGWAVPKGQAQRLDPGVQRGEKFCKRKWQGCVARGERRKGRRCCTGARGTRPRAVSEPRQGEREQTRSSAPSMLPQRRCAGRRVEEEREGLPGTAAC